MVVVDNRTHNNIYPMISRSWIEKVMVGAPWTSPLWDYHQQHQYIDLKEEGKKELNEGGRGGKHASMITKGTSVGVGITNLVNT